MNYSSQRNLLHTLTLIFSYGGKEQIAIDQKITLDELNSFTKHENNSRVLKRLYFIKFRYLGDSVEEAAIKIGVTKKTGYYWQEAWSQAAMPP